MIVVKENFEPLCDIPEHSVIQLVTGERFHYLGVRASDYDRNTYEAEVVPLEDQRQHFWIAPTTAARYVCSITDYEARAAIA